MFERRGLIFSLVVVACAIIGLTVWSGAAAGRVEPAGRPGSAGQLAPRPQMNSAQIWQAEIVDMPGFFHYMSDHSLAFDGTGKLHVAYGGDRLRYATFDGGGWQVEIVDPHIGTGMGAALALDAAGRPHISYLDVNNFELRYAHWNGETWNIQVLDDARGYSERTAIDIDEAGQPHIIYKTNERIPPGYISRYIGYAHWTGSQWELERLDFGGLYLSFALDSTGAPHISFFSNIEFRHATKVGGEWFVEPVGPSGPGYGSSIALDSQDRPHVAYIDDDQDAQLVYAYLDGSDWISSTITAAWPGLNVSLTLDEADVAHIALGNQYVTVGADQEMTIEAVGATLSMYSAIALDGDGHAAISYVTEKNLRCDRWDGDKWMSDLVDDGGSAGLINSVELGSSGEAHLGYYTAYGSDGAAIRYARSSGATWSTETITMTYMPQPLHSGYDISLAVDSDDRPHVAFWYSDYYTDGLYYGYKSGDSWQLEMIADATGGGNDLAMDSADRPHVAFIENSRLKYGQRNAGGWLIDDLPTGPQFVSGFSLALDKADRPHFAYVTVANDIKHLALAAWTGTDWTFSDIEELGLEQQYESVALALDELGNPHIAYVVDIGSGDISEVRYATRSGEKWTIEVVDDRPWSKGAPEIVLDWQGDPAIVFTDPALPNRGIQVASRIEGQWQVETVAATDAGDYSACGDGHRLYVAYHDELGQGLMLTGPSALSRRVYLPAALKQVGQSSGWDVD